VGRKQAPFLFVQLAYNSRPVRQAVQGVANEHLQERTLLFDHQDLLQSAGELTQRARFQWKQHPEFEYPNAVAVQRLVVETKVAEGVFDVVVGLAGSDDSQPGISRRYGDAVEVVLTRVLAGEHQPRLVQRPLQLQVGRRQQR